MNAEAAGYDSIRQTAASLRTRATELRDAIAVESVKIRLALAITQLSDIDAFLLKNAENASAQYESMWRQAAVQNLQLAESTIKDVQEKVDKYGYDMLVIG